MLIVWSSVGSENMHIEFYRKPTGLVKKLAILSSIA